MTEELRTLEREHAKISQRLHARRIAISDAESRLDALSRDRLVCNSETQAYVDSHRFAADCIRMSRKSWNDSSQNATPLQYLGTAVCSAALLTDAFKREVDAVAAKLAASERRIQQIDAESTSLQRSIDAQRKLIVEDEAALQLVEAQRTDLKIRIGIP